MSVGCGVCLCGVCWVEVHTSHAGDACCFSGCCCRCAGDAVGGACRAMADLVESNTAAGLSEQETQLLEVLGKWDGA